jgi:two-component system, cell cycle response regulator CpdR
MLYIMCEKTTATVLEGGIHMRKDIVLYTDDLELQELVVALTTKEVIEFNSAAGPANLIEHFETNFETEFLLIVDLDVPGFFPPGIPNNVVAAGVLRKAGAQKITRMRLQQVISMDEPGFVTKLKELIDKDNEGRSSDNEGKSSEAGDSNFKRSLENEGGLEILVVDDEGSMRELIALNLRERGYRVDVAENGSDAFKMLRNKRYDVAVIDIVMPGMSGPYLVSKIKQDLPELFVIFMTGLAADYEIMRTYEKELGYSVVRKPFKIETLLEYFTLAVIGAAMGRKCMPPLSATENRSGSRP